MNLYWIIGIILVLIIILIILYNYIQNVKKYPSNVINKKNNLPKSISFLNVKDEVKCKDISTGEIKRFKRVKIAGDGWCYYRAILAGNKYNEKLKINEDKVKKSLKKNDPEIEFLKLFLSAIKLGLEDDINLNKEYTLIEEDFEDKVRVMDRLYKDYVLINWGDASISANVVSDILNSNIIIYRWDEDGNEKDFRCKKFGNITTYPQPYFEYKTKIYLLHQGDRGSAHYDLLIPV